VRFLRRGDEKTPSETETAESPVTQKPKDPRWTEGKGRPTPKRRDAQGAKRGPVAPPPTTQREASRRARENRPTKEARREAAADRRRRMDAGDQKVLLPRDRGPVKAYIRDVVDSRPHIMGLFMPLAVIVLISVLLPIPSIQQYLSLFSLVVLAIMVVEGVTLGARVTRQARVKFPDERISGLGTGWYAFTRASQIRRLRTPKPRVERGAKVS
jgi:hypothetical protein